MAFNFIEFDVMLIANIPIPLNGITGMLRVSNNSSYTGGLQKIETKQNATDLATEREYYIEPTQLIHTINFSINKSNSFTGNATSDFFSLLFPFMQLLDNINPNKLSNNDNETKRLYIQSFNFAYFGADATSPLLITNSFITNISYTSADNNNSERQLSITVQDTSLIKETISKANNFTPAKKPTITSERVIL